MDWNHLSIIFKDNLDKEKNKCFIYKWAHLVKEMMLSLEEFDILLSHNQNIIS